MENVIEQGTVKQEVETQQPKEKVSTGKITGKRFIQAFGFYLDESRNETGNKEIVKQKMLEEFPAKSGSVEKWLDWYKGYFNMGKIKGYENAEKVKWNA